MFIKGVQITPVPVVYNLLDNAVKYSRETGPIDVASRTTDSEAIVSVGDHGPGISEENQKRLLLRRNTSPSRR